MMDRIDRLLCIRKAVSKATEELSEPTLFHGNILSLDDRDILEHFTEIIMDELESSYDFFEIKTDIINGNVIKVPFENSSDLYLIARAFKNASNSDYYMNEDNPNVIKRYLEISKTISQQADKIKEVEQEEALRKYKEQQKNERLKLYQELKKEFGGQ